VPGVVISLMLTACVGKYMFDYDWDWNTSLMFGSILAATDPVAVVALLHDVGASKRLATLIEAESLLNDGSAFVFFLIFRDRLIGVDRSTGELVGFFCRLSFGALGWGLLVGIPTVIWLTHVFNNAVVETTITLTAAYFTFWMAENHDVGLEVSSVLSVVVLGLVLSRFKSSISPQTEHSLHHMWSFVGYLANTLIFVISGAIVAEKLFANEGGHLGWSDLGLLIMLYVMILIIRAVTVALLWPFLTRIGYGMTVPNASVLVYGGLRGAIGLALGLLVELEDDIDEGIRTRLLFHVAGIVLLTLVVNGSTTGLLLKKLGLTGSTPASDLIFREALKHLEQEKQMLEDSLKHNRLFAGANWARVRELMPQYCDHAHLQMQHDVTQENLAQISGASTDQSAPESDSEMYIDENTIASNSVEMTDLKQNDDTAATHAVPPVKLQAIPAMNRGTSMIGEAIRGMQTVHHDAIRREVSERVLSAMKCQYHVQYKQGAISRSTVTLLQASVDAAFDAGDDEDPFVVQWEVIASHLPLPWWLTYVGKVSSWLYSRFGQLHMVDALDVASGYLSSIHALTQLNEDLSEFRDLQQMADIEETLVQLRDGCYTWWIEAQQGFPHVGEHIQTLHVANLMLHHEEDQVEHLQHNGIISDNEASIMKLLIEESLYRTGQSSIPDSLVSQSELMRELTFFDRLSPELQEELLSLPASLFDPGHVLQREGELSHGVYVIVRGIVQICRNPSKQTPFGQPIVGSAEIDTQSATAVNLGRGTFLGMYGAITSSPVLVTSKAQTVVAAVYLNCKILEKIMSHTRAARRMWKLAAGIVIKTLFRSVFAYCGVGIDALCLRGQFVASTQSGQVLAFAGPTLLLSGQCMNMRTGEKIFAPAMLATTGDMSILYKFAGKSRLLKFRRSLDELVRASATQPTAAAVAPLRSPRNQRSLSIASASPQLTPRLVHQPSAFERLSSMPDLSRLAKGDSPVATSGMRRRFQIESAMDHDNSRSTTVAQQPSTLQDKMQDD
jgi:NhaP-type Na+/H+ or K+/H+ antiporter